MASFVCYVNLLIIFATQQKYHLSFMIPRSPFLSKQKQVKITFDLQKIAYIFLIEIDKFSGKQLLNELKLFLSYCEVM